MSFCSLEPSVESHPESLPATLRIATRESRLALWQAEHVRALLADRLGVTAELLPMTTRGDRILDRSLSKVGGKGLFVKELENALQAGEAELAVHSLKDVPMDLPDGFVLAAVLEREDPRDAFVSNDHPDIAALPEGAVVGTSSLRRVVQLRAMRPDLRIEPLRGNLDTRLRKLDAGDYQAIVLAAAGLRRLGLQQRIRALFDTSDMLPCAGQGALAIEIRGGDTALGRSLARLDHLPSRLAAYAERAVSRTLGGSCSMPLAAYASWRGEVLELRAAVGHPRRLGLPLLQATASAVVAAHADAVALGAEAARLLTGAGAADYLAGG